jgi:hypothetical protein
MLSTACSDSPSPKTDQSYNANVPDVKVFSIVKVNSNNIVSFTPVGNELYVLTNGEADKARYIILTEPEAVHLNSLLRAIDPVADADEIADPVVTDEQIVLTIPDDGVFHKFTSGYAPDGTFHLMSRDVQIFVDYVLYLDEVNTMPKGTG